MANQRPEERAAAIRSLHTVEGSLDRVTADQAIIEPSIDFLMHKGDASDEFITDQVGLAVLLVSLNLHLIVLVCE